MTQALYRLRVRFWPKYFVGDDVAVIRKAREALQLDPEHLLAIEHLLRAYANINDAAALTSLLDSLSPALRARAEIKAHIARNYALQGDETQAREIYNDLVASLENLTPLAVFDTALLAISRGEIDDSVVVMERLEKPILGCNSGARFCPGKIKLSAKILGTRPC